MKLRIEGNSLRIRIRKSELEQLKQGETLSETLIFGNGISLSYLLCIGTNSAPVEAVFLNNEIKVHLSKQAAAAWLENAEVSLEHTTTEGMYILVEKDFPCKDRANEDKNDLFAELVANTAVFC